MPLSSFYLIGSYQTFLAMSLDQSRRRLLWQFALGVHFRVQFDRERCEARGDMQTLDAHTKMTHKNKACALREIP
jgi:hypothetical protein